MTRCLGGNESRIISREGSGTHACLYTRTSCGECKRRGRGGREGREEASGSGGEEASGRGGEEASGKGGEEEGGEEGRTETRRRTDRSSEARRCAGQTICGSMCRRYGLPACNEHKQHAHRAIIMQ